MKNKIDKNIPIPTKTNSKYPFGEMEVGDSIEIKNIDLAYNSAAAAGRRFAPKKFKAGTHDGVARIWRTA